MPLRDQCSSGLLVRRIRERVRFSQKSVARTAAIHPSHLARFESGSFIPPVETVSRILDAMAVEKSEREMVLSRVCADRFDWQEFQRYRPQINCAISTAFRNLMLLDEKQLLALNAYIASCVGSPTI